MNKYYFTFGIEGQPYKGGWVIVEAQNLEQSIAVFRAVFPDIRKGLVNCAGIYSEEKFLQTSMYKKNDNFGSGCHGTISLNISLQEKRPSEVELKTVKP